MCEKFGLFSLSPTEPDTCNVRHPVVLSAFTNSTCTQTQHCYACWCTSDTIGDESKKLKPSIVFPNPVLLFILLFLPERKPVAFLSSLLL